MPGAGKTMIASIVFDDLCTRFQNDASVGIAYLYCNFRRQQEQKPADLLASLLKQFVQEQPSMPESMKSLYERHKGKRTRPELDEISKALHSVVADYSRAFIIIDALDECQVSDGGRRMLLSQIINLQAKTEANFFATSRFIPEIAKDFEGSISLEIRASDEDVQKYLIGHMTRLPSCVSRNPALQEKIKAEILKAVDGMFLLAQLHLDSLIDKTTPKAIRSALEKLPKGLEAYDHAYKEAMERIEGQKLGFQKLAKQVLSWITFAKRPLTTLELRHALAVEVGESEFNEENLSEIEDMVSICAGLVIIDEKSDIIRLIHYTAQEYFKRTWISWFPDVQEDIAITCVTYLSFNAFKTGSCATNEEFEARLRLNPLYDYAAQNWGYHARIASTEVERSVLALLENEAKVSASSQAMMASNRYRYGDYSHKVPRQLTGVHLAAYFGLEEITSTLLKKEYQSDCKDTYGRTPLSWAAKNGYETVVKLLLEKGAELESKDEEYGQTPLSLAAGNGHETVVKLLLEKDAQLESKDNRRQTPLSWAARTGNKAVVKLLQPQGGLPS